MELRSPALQADSSKWAMKETHMEYIIIDIIYMIYEIYNVYEIYNYMKYTATKFLEKSSKKPSGSKESWKDPRVCNWINNKKKLIKIEFQNSNGLLYKRLCWRDEKIIYRQRLTESKRKVNTKKGILEEGPCITYYVLLCIIYCVYYHVLSSMW